MGGGYFFIPRWGLNLKKLINISKFWNHNYFAIKKDFILNQFKMIQTVDLFLNLTLSLIFENFNNQNKNYNEFC